MEYIVELQNRQNCHFYIYNIEEHSFFLHEELVLQKTSSKFYLSLSVQSQASDNIKSIQRHIMAHSSSILNQNNKASNTAKLYI